MRYVERHPVSNIPKIERSQDRDARLESYLSMEIEDALTARRPIERMINEARRQYAGVPKRPMREVPIPNAPNIEIPIGAILADDIFAQATDTLFTASPLLIVRPNQEFWVEHAKVAQDWVNWLSSNEIDLRPAVNAALSDDTQLGTGVYYIPFVEQTKKDRVYKVTYRSPKVYAISLEDWITPPGSRGDVQRDRWTAIRFWYSKGELEERARHRGWDISQAQPVAQFDLVRLQHERKANLRGQQLWREVYEVCEVYAYFDYDEDGMEEDLLVTWDRASRRVLDVTFNPYDLRPIEVMRYQLRAHLPYGLGILEMVQPFQEEITELHMHTLLNIFLANARVWACRAGTVPDNVEIVPGKFLNVNTDDIRNSIVELKMSEVYPSAFNAQTMSIQLAERRIGTSGAAGMLAKGGSRTPGVTALSLLQQINRRFAPAFDDMREKTAAAVRQAIYRYRERLLIGDQKIRQHIENVVGAEGAELLDELLTSDDFDKAVSVEFTAASASINREADRQNAVMLTQLLGQYYPQIVGLAMQAAQGQVPPEVRSLLVDAAKKGTELMERTLRTFDQVRDPKAFLMDPDKIESAVEASAAQAEQQALMQQVIQGLAMQQQQPQLGAPMGPEDQAAQEPDVGAAQAEGEMAGGAPAAGPLNGGGLA